MSAPMPAPTHPLAPWLRARVMALRAATRRRMFPPSLELVTADPGACGEPATAWRYADLAPWHDHAMRVDVLVRLLTDCAEMGFPSVGAVHVRPGTHHDLTDVDLAWLRAATVAAQVSGTDVSAVVAVSRWGWRDLLTGAERSWRRLRPR